MPGHTQKVLADGPPGETIPTAYEGRPLPAPDLGGPGATETCNGIDDDGNLDVDETCPTDSCSVSGQWCDENNNDDSLEQYPDWSLMGYYYVGTCWYKFTEGKYDPLAVPAISWTSAALDL